MSSARKMEPRAPRGAIVHSVLLRLTPEARDALDYLAASQGITQVEAARRALMAEAERQRRKRAR